MAVAPLPETRSVREPMTLTTILPILFRVLLAVGPTLLALASHNYATVADAGLSFLDAFLKTHGLALAGIASLVGAERAHSKIVSTSAASIPAIPAKPDSRKKILDLLWADIGTDGSDAEVAAFKQIRDANKTQPGAVR